MDVKVLKIEMPKRIDWIDVYRTTPLYVEMMRNRVFLYLEADDIAEASKQPMKDIDLFCSRNNVGLYAIEYRPMTSPLQAAIEIYFEDHEDMARFTRDQLVMFRLCN